MRVYCVIIDSRKVYNIRVYFEDNLMKDKVWDKLSVFVKDVDSRSDNSDDYNDDKSSGCFKYFVYMDLI